MELALRVTVAEFGPDRASPARGAVMRNAIRAVWPVHVVRARRQIVSARRERPDRAGRQTWPVRTGIAGADPAHHNGAIESFGQRQGAAIGMPRSVLGMDQHADRRWMDGLSPSPAALKIDARRRTERKI